MHFGRKILTTLRLDSKKSIKLCQFILYELTLIGAL